MSPKFRGSCTDKFAVMRQVLREFEKMKTSAPAADFKQGINRAVQKFQELEQDLQQWAQPFETEMKELRIFCEMAKGLGDRITKHMDENPTYFSSHSSQNSTVSAKNTKSSKNSEGKK